MFVNVRRRDSEVRSRGLMHIHHAAALIPNEKGSERALVLPQAQLS